MTEKWVIVHVNSYNEADEAIGIFSSKEDAEQSIWDEHYYASGTWTPVRIARPENDRWA